MPNNHNLELVLELLETIEEAKMEAQNESL